MLQQGKNFLEQKEYDQAIDQYQNILKIKPKHPDAIFYLGYAFLEHGEYNQSIEQFQKVLKVHPRNINALYNLGLSFVNNNEFDKAIEHFQQILNIEPNNIDALNELGFSFLEQGNYNQAIEKFEKILKIDAENINALYNLGVTLLEKDKHDQAMTKFQQVLNINPENINALYNLGITLLEKSKYDESMLQFQKVLKNQPQHIEALHNIGFVFAKKGDHDQAIEQFQKVLNINPENINALYNLGTVFLRQDNYDQAIQQFQEVLTIDSKHIGALNNIGTTLLNKGNFEKAIKQFHHLLDIKTDDLQTLTNLGIAYGSKEDYDSALEYLRRAQDVNPQDKVVQNYIAKAIRLQNKESETEIETEQLYTTYDCKNWSEINVQIKEIQQENEFSVLLYRGHEDADWELKPTIYRGQKNKFDAYKKTFQLKANQFLDDFDSALLRKGREKELEAQMQHYGIPTHYLDWTESPLTALYFALAKGDDFNETPITDICLWVVSIPEENIKMLTEEFKPQSETKEKVHFLVPELNNQRIVNQKGYFSYVTGDQGDQCLSHTLKDYSDIKLFKIVLNNDFEGTQNKAAKKDLLRLGMSPTSIYPDFIGLKQEVLGHSKDFKQSTYESHKDFDL